MCLDNSDILWEMFMPDIPTVSTPEWEKLIDFSFFKSNSSVYFVLRPHSVKCWKVWVTPASIKLKISKNNGSNGLD